MMNLKTTVGAVVLGAALTVHGIAQQAKPTKPAPPPAKATDYRLGSEDLIECFVYREAELTVTVVVRPDGMISLPLVGEVQAAGKTALELQAVITSRLSEFITEPLVSVIVKEINSPKLSVFGEVRKADVFPIKQPMTVLNAIALAGGFTEFAKRDRVIVIRAGASGQERIALNLDRLIADGAPFHLQASDTVFVEREVTEANSPKIAVFGEVRKPDVFAAITRMTVLDAMAMAGGFSEFARRDRVIVIRAASSGQERITLNLDRLIADGAPFYLQASDTVFVEREIKVASVPKVSVFGQVRRPDAFTATPQMTVLDAIAMAGGFTEFAKRDHIIVIRAGKSGQERFTLNPERLIKEGAPFYLQVSDIVFVE